MRACLLVHVRHCFKLSSYWNGKEWRKAGAEEQATPGGERESEREQRGHWRVKILLLFPQIVETQKRGINLSQGLRAAISRQQQPPRLFFAVCLLNLNNAALVKYLTQSR